VRVSVGPQEESNARAAWAGRAGTQPQSSTNSGLQPPHTHPCKVNTCRAVGKRASLAQKGGGEMWMTEQAQ
jgi:hypothetical protein